MVLLVLYKKKENQKIQSILMTLKRPNHIEI